MNRQASGVGLVAAAVAAPSRPLPRSRRPGSVSDGHVGTRAGTGVGTHTDTHTDTRVGAEELRKRLQAWLPSVLPPHAEPVVTDAWVSDANPLSGDMVRFDAVWGQPPNRWSRELSAKLAPRDTVVPLFPRHGLDRQFETMHVVRENTRVPVPAPLWLETDPEPLGTPFLVMQRAQGRVPPDMVPYNFGSWLTEATDAQRATLQHTSIDVLVKLHDIAEPGVRRAFPSPGTRPPPSAASALADHVERQRAYHRWVTARGPDAPIIGRCFDWLEDNWPRRVGQAVLGWGDARIGNITYDGFTPAAVLGWRMSALGPRELDLGWFIYQHRFFEDLAAVAGLPGLPGFLRRDDVCGDYEAMSGYRPRDMNFFTLYAALRYAIVLLRVRHRAIRLGRAVVPADPDDMLLHRPALEAMLAGTYWAGVG
ncbi:phosphotransferase family protein [Pseudonocardia acaciae]|uniref:phosphotransferase family protein n=1 Tax=Pseudonocardia acaciae TaxID=551276 RepID=UPI0009FE2B60|nr:phosphotransferase family protein [Pseudonocardia acaciae]